MRNIFLKFLGTYILILLVPVIMGWVIYEIVAKEFENYIKSTHISLLNQTMEVVDRYTKEIEWKVFQIANNRKLKSLMYEDKTDILFIKEIINELSSYVIYTRNFNTTFYVYLKDPDMIITPNAVYRFPDFIRGEVFFKVEGMTAGDWQEKTLSRYYPGVFLETKRMIIEDYDQVGMAKMVPYIQSLPPGFHKSPDDVTGVILYFIREAEFTVLLNNLDVPRGGWVYIADETGSLVAGVSDNEAGFHLVEYNSAEKEGLKKITLAGKELFAIYTTSAVNRWKYTAVLPVQFVLDKVRIIKSVALPAILISVFLSILFSVIIAYKRAKPFKKMISLLKDASETDSRGDLSNMNVLGGSISGLINTSRELQRQLREQRQFVRTFLFNNLLHGYFRNSQELNAFLSYAGISIAEAQFAVLVQNLPGYEILGSTDIIEELHKVKVLVRNTWEQVLPEKIFFCDLDERKMAVIVALQDNTGKEYLAYITNAINQFYNTLALYYRVKPQIGIGNFCSALMEINNSFEQAREALNYLLKTGTEQMAWFGDIHRETQDYYFPLELEMRLLNAAKAGDKTQVTSILETVYAENFLKRSILPEKTRELFYEMQGTLVKIKNQVSLDGIEIRMEPADAPDTVFAYLRNLYFRICDQINIRKKSHNTELIKKIMLSLETEYSNPNLCLCSVSSSFSLNESYLSFFFKEQTGMNFSFYLEKIRIGHATELLLGSTAAINDIARCVGYHSDKTFRRVFKRVNGISPGAFRQEQRRQKL